MSKVLILGGGFAGVVAAESLAKRLGGAHEITLVSRSRKFLFYPALVRLAFGQCTAGDIAFDLREAMLDRGITFMEGEAARVNIQEHKVTISGDEFCGEMPYDFLVIALGRRLATEQITGFFEYAHHLLSIDGARKFGEALRNFHQGRAIIGLCPAARLPVPLFETAFSLSRLLEERGERQRCEITIVSNETPDEMFGGVPMSAPLQAALSSQGIELVSGFAVKTVRPNSLIAEDGRVLNCDLSMLIPPFRGPGAVRGQGITDQDGYVRVDRSMRVIGLERVYAAGDCVSFQGPKMGHMAVKQGEVAAENLRAEIEGRPPPAVYDHEMMLVIDTGNQDSFFLHKDLWTEEAANIQQGRLWAQAKRQQERYWKAKHA